MAFTSLKQLVAALRIGDPDARRELQALCRSHAVALVVDVTRRYALDEDEEEDSDRLVDQVVCWFSALLISLPESKIQRLESPDERPSRENSEASLVELGSLVEFFLVVAYRHFMYGPAVLLKGRRSALLGPSRHGGIPTEDSVSFTLSGQRVATRWLRMPVKVVSGDLADHAEVGDALWIVIGDATGHGWLAYAVIDGVAFLWKALLNDSPNTNPHSLCEQLDQRLEACLPDSMFVEAALARFNPDRTASASFAGNCRVMTRRKGESNVELEKVGNLFLGMGLPIRDEKEITFDVGDEILLTSDGIREQPVGDGTLDDSLVDQIVKFGESVPLYDALVTIIRDTLADDEQKDDITAATIQYVEDSGVEGST